jgi:peptidoglycan-associated lipoprotein
MKVEIGILVAVASVALFVAGCTTTSTVKQNDKAYAMRQRHVSLDSATTSGPAVGRGGGAGGGAHGDWISAETAGSLLEYRNLVNEQGLYGSTGSQDDLDSQYAEIPEELDESTVNDPFEEILGNGSGLDAGPESYVRPGYEDEMSPELIAAAAALQTVHFEFDKAEIRDDQMEVIKDNARYLREHPNIAVNLEGHCDERGTDEYNMALSERRALTVREAMISMGIQPHRLSSVPYGEADPVDPGHTEDAYAQNRRVEFAPTSVQLLSMGGATE